VKIDRRKFIIKTRDLLIYSPLAVSAFDLASCKKVETPIEKNESYSLAAKVRTHSSGPRKMVINKPAIADANITDGYLDKQSYLPGETCEVFISSNATYQNGYINIYDMNSRVVLQVPFTQLISQTPQTDAPFEKGYGYMASVNFTLPDLKSNVYLIANKIPLVVKSADSAVDFTVVYPSNTENAYCVSGGRSLYVNPNPAAATVSFLRPIPLSYYAGGFFRWILAHQTYNYNVIADSDLEDPTNIKGKLLIIPGHGEYWTRNARVNFDAHVSSGNPALVLSGNTMYWQVRYNGSNDQLICYKSIKNDPIADPLLKTGLWANPSLKYPIVPSIGVSALNGGYGDRGTGSWKGFKITNASCPLFSGTGLKNGDIMPCDTHEYDGSPITGIDSNGYPILDASSFYKSNLLGFDIALDYYNVNKYNYATALITQRSATAGVIVNMPTTNWCTLHSMRDDAVANLPMHTITKNAIDCLLNDINLF